MLTKAIENRDDLHIGEVVLCEVVWFFVRPMATRSPRSSTRWTTFSKPRSSSSKTATFFGEALRAYGTGPADFADYLIGRRNARAGCDHTVTFDRALKSHPTFVLL